MAKETQTTEEVVEVTEQEQDTLLGAARKVLLASVGAIALAQDELEDFVGRLVERGEIAEKDGRQLVRDWIERRRRETERAEEELDERVTELLRRMNVPTKSDIEALSAKISELSAKVDELKQEQT